MQLKGLFTALVTPFRNDEINWELFDILFQRQIDAQVDGVVLMGTTGEAPTISTEERTLLVRRAVEQAQGRTLVIAGIGTNSTKTTREQAKNAAAAGANALQLVLPSYNKPTQEGLAAHIRSIHETTSLPLCLYNIPGRTGVNLLPKTLGSLQDCTRIVAIKESSENLPQMMDIYESAPFIRLFSGDDLLFLPTTSIGGVGVTSVISNLLPKTMKKLVNWALQGEVQQAKELFYKIKPLIQACFFETNPGPIKTMLALAGFDVGPPRLPLVPVSDATKAKLQLLLLNSTSLLEYETCNTLHPATR